MVFGTLQSTIVVLWSQQVGVPGISGMKEFISQCVLLSELKLEYLPLTSFCQ